MTRTDLLWVQWEMYKGLRELRTTSPVIVYSPSLFSAQGMLIRRAPFNPHPGRVWSLESALIPTLFLRNTASYSSEPHRVLEQYLTLHCNLNRYPQRSKNNENCTRLFPYHSICLPHQQRVIRHSLSGHMPTSQAHFPGWRGAYGRRWVLGSLPQDLWVRVFADEAVLS